MIELNRVIFKTEEEALVKLKEIGLISKTKTKSALNEIVYKTVNDDIVTTHECKVIGFNWKYNENKDCINPIYENLTIASDDREFDINIDYLKEMQKKNFGKNNDK